MSNIKKQFKQLGCRLKQFRPDQRVKEQDSHDRTDDVIIISDSEDANSVPVPTIVEPALDQDENAFVKVFHTKYYAENGQAIPVAPISINPHPCLSIMMAFLQEAIMDCRKPGSWYEVSILRREFVKKNEMGNALAKRILSGQDSSWRWIPYVSRGAVHRYAPKRFYPGDVEVISIRNDVIQSKIERNDRVFEHPANVGEVSSTRTNIEVDFSELEKAGWRVLVWRVCGTNMNRRRYMDRQGRLIVDPMAPQVTEVED